MKYCHEIKKLKLEIEYFNYIHKKNSHFITNKINDFHILCTHLHYFSDLHLNNTHTQKKKKLKSNNSNKQNIKYLFYIKQQTNKQTNKQIFLFTQNNNNNIFKQTLNKNKIKN